MTEAAPDTPPPTSFHQLAHWEPTGPAELTASAHGLRVLRVPARWTEPSHEPLGHFVQVEDADGGLVGDFRCMRGCAPQQIETGWRFRLHMFDSTHVLIFDSAQGRCRLAGGQWLPLPAMQSLIDTALADMLRTDRTSFEYSPDGQIRIDYVHEDWAMSVWTQTPTITHLETGETLFSMAEAMWDATVDWRDDGRFALSVRHYGRRGQALALFDPAARTVRLGEDGPAHPIHDAMSLIETCFSEPAKISLAPWRGSARPPLWQGLLSFVVMMGVLALIIAAGYAYEQYRQAHPPPPELLKAVPAPRTDVSRP